VLRLRVCLSGFLPGGSPFDVGGVASPLGVTGVAVLDAGGRSPCRSGDVEPVISGSARCSSSLPAGPCWASLLSTWRRSSPTADSASGSIGSTTPHLADVTSPLARCHPWPAGAALRSIGGDRTSEITGLSALVVLPTVFLNLALPGTMLTRGRCRVSGLWFGPGSVPPMFMAGEAPLLRADQEVFEAMLWAGRSSSARVGPLFMP